MSVADTDIIAAIRENPERGFNVLLSEYSRRIYWHIRRAVISHHDAEDVTQETFMRVFRSLAMLRSADALRTWIYRIATNEVLRFLDRRGSDFLPLDEAVELPSDGYVDYSDVEAVELKKAINTLPPKQRMTFNLRYYDGLGYEEIASILETTAPNARANYHNAKARIVKYMNDINWNM